MKKTWKDTINNSEVEFIILVTEHTKKGKKSTHPDFEDAAPRMITEYSVVGHVGIAGEMHQAVHKSTYYNESSLLDGLPLFESTLFDRAMILEKNSKVDNFSTKLKKLGYE